MHDLKVDIHIHSEKLIPQPFRKIYRFLNRKTIPNELILPDLEKYGIDISIVNAVGDKLVTNFYGLNGYYGVKKQIKKIKNQINECGAILYEEFSSIKEAQELKKPLFILGVEGGDFINNRIERVREISELGVRSLTLVHFSNNCIGSAGTNVSQLLSTKNKKGQDKEKGLTEFGKKVVEEIENYSIIIDLSHANFKTAIDTYDIAKNPLLISHSGVKSIFNFSRYITDIELERLQKNGGIIGLWPYFFKDIGTKNLQEFIKHAVYVKNKIGSKHLAVGTDMNGLPGALEKFNYTTFFDDLKEELYKNKFSEEEVSGIIGYNFISFLKKINNTE